METLMKVDPKVVKKLREAKAWSQDQLSEVADLSLRTIQRVEADGTASAETKMAIASAFGISADDLTPKLLTKLSLPLGTAVGAGSGIAGVAFGATFACIGAASGSNTAFETGVAYGLIGLASGLCCALIGTISNRYFRA